MPAKTPSATITPWGKSNPGLAAAARLAEQAAKQQAAQNAHNAKYFAAYYAAHPELTPPAGTPGIRTNAAQPTTPGTTPQSQPTGSRPPVQPFLTPEQEQSRIQQFAGWARDEGDLKFNLAKSEGDTALGITQAERTAERNSAQAVDNMIARGLFHSSIKDGELADIATAKKARQDYLTSALSSLQIYTAGRLSSIETARNNYQSSVNAQAVANAQGVTPVPDTPATDPGAAAPAAPQAPEAPRTTWGHQMNFGSEPPASSAPTVKAVTPQPKSQEVKSYFSVAPQSAHIGAGLLPKVPRTPTVKKGA